MTHEIPLLFGFCCLSWCFGYVAGYVKRSQGE